MTDVQVRAMLANSRELHVMLAAANRGEDSLMFLNELRHAARNVSRAPRFTLACVFTLAFAFAGTATLLNVLETFVFRRLAVSAPDRLVGIYPATGEFSAGFSPQALQALRDRQQVLTDVCGVTAGYGTLGVQFRSGVARQRPVEAVTGNCYELLGIHAALGRLITSTDAPLTGTPEPVVVISDRIWREEFGASPDVLGQIVRLEGTALTIVGVLPSAYRGMNADEAPDLALPVTLPWKLKLNPPLVMHAVGRLRPGISLEQAAAHLAAIWPDAFTATQTVTPASIPTLHTVSLANGFSILRERYHRPLYALVALAGCLLLLACVNTGGLSLARMLDRRETLAVQLALGARTSRLATQLLCESLLIGAAATLLAIPIARWGAGLVASSLWAGYRPFTIQPAPVLTTLLITALVGLLASLVIAVPGWIALFAQDWELGARSVGRAARIGHRRGMIAIQLALCFVLAFCAVLFSSNLNAIRQLPLGFEPNRLQFMRLDSTTRTTFAPTLGYVDTLLTSLETLPGVEFAAMSQGGFGSTSQVVNTVAVRRTAGASHVDALTDQVSPGFFRTASIRLHRGRDFSWNDMSNRAAVAILNQSLADRLFPDGDVVGRTIRLGESEQAVSVIGIVADATPGDPRIQDVPQCYLPLGPIAPPAPALLLRFRSDPIPEASLRAVVERLGRHEILRVSTMRAQTEQFLLQERLITSAALFFAALATVVSIAGLYATITQNITRRKREIGIRIAIGATPNMVRALVLTDVGWILLVGLGLGIPAALAGGHAARSLLSVMSTNMTTLLFITGLPVAAAAVFVSAWPAQRAARMSISSALRAD